MKNIVIIILVILLLSFSAVFIWERYGDKSYLEPQDSVAVKIPAQSSATPKNCASLEIEKYQVANIDSMSNQKGELAEFEADLKGDKQKELVKIYDQTTTKDNPSRANPIIIKVFSGSANCYMEEYSFSANIPNPKVPELSIANELGDAQLLPNFWGDGKDGIVVDLIATGYGSGSTRYLDFLTFKNGKYQLISGPVLNELADYKFNGTGAQGKEILVADGYVGWNLSYQGTTQGEGHFDPHLIQVSKYTWDGEKYNQTILGMTKNKYPLNNSTSPILDQITQTEPALFNK